MKTHLKHQVFSLHWVVDDDLILGTLRQEIADLNFFSFLDPRNVKKAIEKLKEGEEWNENFGDRSSEFVCIGIKLEKEKLVEALETALLTDEEFSKGRESWKELDDPILNGTNLWDLKDLIAFGEEKGG